MLTLETVLLGVGCVEHPHSTSLDRSIGQVVGMAQGSSARRITWMHSTCRALKYPD